MEAYFHSKGYRSNYLVAKAWTVSNTVEELLSFLKAQAYGFCWQASEETFNRAIEAFAQFCTERYGSLETELSSEAKFEIWAYNPEANDPVEQ